MECIKQTTTGGGDRLTWTISRNGDLVLNMTLEGMWFREKLPSDVTGFFSELTDERYRTNERAARYYVNSKLDTMRYTLEVGGQTIDRFDNMYRRMFNSLTEKNPTNDGQLLSQ